MHTAGISGARRSKRGARPNPSPAHHGILTWWAGTSPQRHPTSVWVTDLTFVPTWASVTYGCFLTDAYSRTIVGWRSPVTSAPAWSSTPERASWCRN
jgi:putative transposase